MKAVLFDLDGTLINSEEGITKSAQYALKGMGIEEPDLSKLKCFIGPPLQQTFMEKYNFTEEEAWKAVEKYRERYLVTGVIECCPYDGVEETLKSLKEKGYLLAVASSKPEKTCKTILKHFSLDHYFDMIVGATMDGKISTKEQVLEELGRRMTDKQIDKSQMCLVGDTKFDAIGAVQFGIDCIGVSYGFGTKEELEEAGAVYICDHIKEVETYIEEK